jgi:uncharacterized tellurite resistance protein B-like protein
VATLEGELAAPAGEKLRALVMAQFDLTEALTDELIEAAVAADREAVDFYHVTSLLMRTLDEAGRLRIVEMLWEIAFADGIVTEFEDNVLWRVAELLAVSPNDVSRCASALPKNAPTRRNRERTPGPPPGHADYRRLGRHRRRLGARLCRERARARAGGAARAATRRACRHHRRFRRRPAACRRARPHPHRCRSADRGRTRPARA